jgi:hypothetical protein
MLGCLIIVAAGAVLLALMGLGLFLFLGRIVDEADRA